MDKLINIWDLLIKVVEEESLSLTGSQHHGQLILKTARLMMHFGLFDIDCPIRLVNEDVVGVNCRDFGVNILIW